MRDDNKIYITNSSDLPEITITAPRKYFVGYDENVNPVYTTDRTLSQDYLQSQIPVGSAEQKRRQWAFENVGANGQTKPGIQGDAKNISRLVTAGIGSTLAPIAVAPVARAVFPAVRTLASAGRTTWNAIKPGGTIPNWLYRQTFTPQGTLTSGATELLGSTVAGEGFNEMLNQKSKSGDWTEDVDHKYFHGDIGNTIGEEGRSMFLTAPLYGTYNAGKQMVNGVKNLGKRFVNPYVISREINYAAKNKPKIEIPKATQYNINDNITLYRADASTPNGFNPVEGDKYGLFVGKWFTDEPIKPNIYAANYAKRGETPLYYLVTVPRYWANKQRAKYKLPNNIEFEPEDYILEDGVSGLIGLPYNGRPGTLNFLLQTFDIIPKQKPSTITWGKASTIIYDNYTGSPYQNHLGEGENFDWELFGRYVKGLKSNRFGKWIGSGGEQIVYEDTSNPDQVLKIHTEIQSASPEKLREKPLLNIRLSSRNKVPYLQQNKLFGFIKVGDKYYPVTKLLKLQNLSDELDIYFSRDIKPRIERLLSAKGFYPTKSGYDFTNGNILLTDFKPQNIGFDKNGNIRFFDIQSFKN